MEAAICAQLFRGAVKICPLVSKSTNSERKVDKTRDSQKNETQKWIFPKF